ncbi:MAG: hypothetical protein GKS06_19510 [Acidobacteria bacterium]|nr:hypothetical protein [Acidobacteriota bacterium]
MHEVSVHRDIAVPAETAWEHLSAFGDVYKIHPFVTRSYVTGEDATGLGATRVCVLDDGNEIAEQITEYREGHGYTVSITDPGPFPLREAVARIDVEPRAAGSRVSINMRFQPKFGPLGWLMAKAMMRREFGRRLGLLIEGMEEHAQTGRPVGAAVDDLAA